LGGQWYLKVEGKNTMSGKGIYREKGITRGEGTAERGSSGARKHLSARIMHKKREGVQSLKKNLS